MNPNNKIEADWNVTADVWSATSFTELQREGREAERWNRLHPKEEPRVPYVVQTLRDWRDTFAGAARIAVQEGHFRRDFDCEQFAHDCYGIGLAFVHASRLMGDPKARDRADAAFEALLRAARAADRAPASASAPSGRRR